MKAQTASPRSLAWPTAVVAAAFLVLVGLGAWQLQRLAWKTDLIARIEAGLTAGPVSLPDVEAGIEHGYDIDWLKAEATGRFRHDLERHLYDIEQGKVGYRILTPLETAEGLTLWVDRGFVPEDLKQPDRRAEGQVSGEVRVVGLVRVPPARKPIFSPANEAGRNVWFWPDLQAMSIGGRPPIVGAIMPVYLEATGEAPPGGWPKPAARTKVDIANNHLGYAITWFGLAAGLAGVYIAFARTRMRKTK